jgi:hypothetical protein
MYRTLEAVRWKHLLVAVCLHTYLLLFYHLIFTVSIKLATKLTTLCWRHMLPNSNRLELATFCRWPCSCPKSEQQVALCMI